MKYLLTDFAYSSNWNIDKSSKYNDVTYLIKLNVNNTFFVIYAQKIDKGESINGEDEKQILASLESKWAFSSS